MHGSRAARGCGIEGVCAKKLLTIAQECERGSGSTSTGTGKRADPGEKRRDRRSRRGNNRYRWGWGRRLFRITVMGHSCRLHAGVQTGARCGLMVSTIPLGITKSRMLFYNGWRG